MRPYQEGENLVNLIRTAIPDFAEAEYPLFVEFVECYLRFLEEERTMEVVPVSPEYGQTVNRTANATVSVGGPAYEARKLLEYRDVSTSLDEFTDRFLAMFGKNFPKHAHIPADLLVRSLRSFYLAKGTESSIKWFFRAFLNEQADIYFPREDILKASDGTWYAPITIKVSEPVTVDGNTPTNAEVQQHYIGQRIQTDTGAAQVERVVTTVVGQAFNQNIIVNELTLKFDSIVGTFEPDQLLRNIDAEPQVWTRVLSVITGATVDTGGSNYEVGDLITISEGPAGGGGYGAYGSVSAVGRTALNDVIVNDGGAGFVVGEKIVFTSSTGTGASAIVAEIASATNVIQLELTIFPFVNIAATVTLDDADFGAETGVTQLNGVDLDDLISVALEASDEVPFMHPWVFTSPDESTAELANAAVVLSMTSPANFANGTMIFAISSITDAVTNTSTSAMTANVIVSDNIDDTLYLKQFSDIGQLTLGKILKANGTGTLQTGTVVTDGTANVVGNGTSFTDFAPNTHVRFTGAGVHGVVKSVANDTFMQMWTTIAANVANTFSLIATGVVTERTLQAQTLHGTISRVQLLSAGQNYQTIPSVTVDSVSARAQAVSYLDANGAIQTSDGRIEFFLPADLTAEQDVGQVTRIEILGSGVNYNNPDGVTFTVLHGDGRTGDDAVLSAVVGAVTQYPGQFTTSRGFLSSNKFLQDAEYYNDYTYVIKVAEAFTRYRDILLKLMHPAGFRVLGRFVATLEAPELTLTAEDATVTTS